MGKVSAFSDDYATARQRLLQSASRLGWSIESHSIGVSGPNGEDLTFDSVCSPGDEWENAIVLSSGVHGVEGFFGSAVQLTLLEDWSSLSLPGMRYVFLHGVNPYGFAWIRRFDENNVDLNRNFLLWNEQYANSPVGYSELDSLLNPKRPPSRWEPFALKAFWEISRHGMPALKQAIAAGQYEYPQGLFFGGFVPSKMQQVLSENLKCLLHGIHRVVHLDFHTGLGQMGEFRLLIDYPLSERQRNQLTDLFGHGSFEACGSAGVAYDVRGGFGRWCVSQSFVPDYLFACAEYGTYRPIQIVGGL
ncbi:MAG TPA: M14 family metallopeptidase, partial [Pirellula sp.]|nr:M14 family metallopeptidase [Pirellula sp.]